MSNIVRGEDNQYGRVDVPGRTILHLPAGSVKVSAAVELSGEGGDYQPTLPIPIDLRLLVTPVAGGASGVVRQDLGHSFNTNVSGENTERQVFTVELPQAGRYQVTTAGDFLAIGGNAQLWFGHDPPIHGVMIFILGAALGALVVLLTLVARRRFR